MKFNLPIIEINELGKKRIELDTNYIKNIINIKKDYVENLVKDLKYWNCLEQQNKNPNQNRITDYTASN